MKFSVNIENVQHINSLRFSVDLSKNSLTCIVGKNGVGKTTLIRSIKNLQSTNVFQKTASPFIFNKTSKISYHFDKLNYYFHYNEKIRSIDTKEIISEDIKNLFVVELAMPSGERFNHFQKLSGIDEELRKNISVGRYNEPNKLIDFLSSVYGAGKFENLKEITLKGSYYYFILKDDDYYIREDYLSSGEYFVINLYKSIRRDCKCIVIDEIDISLDASAQVNLIRLLRKFCGYYNVNIIFTTHSLALMKTLESHELYYMEQVKDKVSVELKSYNFIKSLLFGFNGWDKYILTEDRMLENYLTHLLASDARNTFYSYKIIYIAGAGNVIDLLKRNANEKFFSEPGNVLCVLDGDQSDKVASNVTCIPFDSIEKDLLYYYKKNDHNIPIIQLKVPLDHRKAGKHLFRDLTNGEFMTEKQIFLFLDEKKKNAVTKFREQLFNFLN